jgi:hypothetical protein
MPRQTFTNLIISFAGKRHLPVGNKVMSSLENFFIKLSELAQLKEIVMLNGLAEGSDMIAAEVFEKTKMNAHKHLIAVIPMPPEEYLITIEKIEEKVKFKHYWEKANEQIVLKPTATPNSNYPYIVQSDYLVEKGDILLAVADTTGEVKQGGTLDTIEKCLRKGRQVYCYDYLKNVWFFANENNTLIQLEEIKDIKLDKYD